VLPKPEAGFLGREGKGEKREKGDNRRERGGREREGVECTCLLDIGPP